jgi:hypothetical protein
MVEASAVSVVGSTVTVSASAERQNHELSGTGSGRKVSDGHSDTA